MGALGESVRSQVRNLLSDPNIRSEITLQHITRTRGGRGGYDSPTETVTSTDTVYAVPSNNIKARTGLENMGDVQEGELRLLIRDDQTIDSNDKVLYESNTYLIRVIKEIDFNEVTCAKSIILSKVQ